MINILVLSQNFKFKNFTNVSLLFEKTTVFNKNCTYNCDITKICLTNTLMMTLLKRLESQFINDKSFKVMLL